MLKRNRASILVTRQLIHTLIDINTRIPNILFTLNIREQIMSKNKGGFVTFCTVHLKNSITG